MPTTAERTKNCAQLREMVLTTSNGCHGNNMLILQKVNMLEAMIPSDKVGIQLICFNYKIQLNYN